jgi:hypothetical protein
MATGAVNAFQPMIGGTVSTATSTTVSATVKIPPCDAVLLYNAGTTVAFVRFGAADLSGTVTLAASAAVDMPIPGGAQMLIGTGENINAVAVILASTGTAGTLFVTPGNGTQR